MWNNEHYHEVADKMLKIVNFANINEKMIYKSHNEKYRKKAIDSNSGQINSKK